MASADRRVKDIANLDAPKGDDFVEGILRGIDDYNAGRVTDFKSKEKLLNHLKNEI